MIKVFGIGLNKTGTTTLGECGRILGYRCKSCDPKLLKAFVLENNLDSIKQTAEQCDWFEDWPWPLAYQQLDKLFPGSRFILTVRKSAETWLQSLQRHAARKHPTEHCRKLAYGFNSPDANPSEHIDFYHRHNEQVRAYFGGRKCFIELCWERGDGFAELCNFLGRPMPEVGMPHMNKAPPCT